MLKHKKIVAVGAISALCLVGTLGLSGCSLIPTNKPVQEQINPTELMHELLDNPFPSLNGEEANYAETTWYANTKLSAVDSDKVSGTEVFSASSVIKCSDADNVMYMTSELNYDVKASDSGVREGRKSFDITSEEYAIYDNVTEKINERYIRSLSTVTTNGQDETNYRDWEKIVGDIDKSDELAQLESNPDIMTSIFSLKDDLENPTISEDASSYIISGSLNAANCLPDYLNGAMLTANYIKTCEGLSYDLHLIYDKQSKQLTKIEMTYDEASMSKIKEDQIARWGYAGEFKTIESYVTLDQIASSGSLSIPSEVINVASSQQ